MKRPATALALAALLGLSLGSGVVTASSSRSTEPVVQIWDGTQTGWSTLVRTDSGISASYQSTGLPAGQAVTLWFVVFNNPSACAPGPCSAVDLFNNPAAQGDFLIGSGKVIGASGAGNFGAHLRVGDTSGSAFREIGMADRAIGLTNPRGAQVALLLHSHGPIVPGDIPSQLSSFTGGCAVFLGDLEFAGSGLADGPEDVPVAVGECSTIRASLHL
jgi:hypothetical protein